MQWKALPRLLNHTQIRAQISDAERLPVSQLVARSDENGNTQPVDGEQYSRLLTLPVASGRMERVKGIEPSCPAWEAGVLPLNYTRNWLRKG
jgi:hypothetical protein